MEHAASLKTLQLCEPVAYWPNEPGTLSWDFMRKLSVVSFPRLTFISPYLLVIGYASSCKLQISNS